MTKQEIEIVKACKELLEESAAKYGFNVTLKEYFWEGYGGKHINEIEVQLRDKDGYLIKKTMCANCVSEMIGFLSGYGYGKNQNNEEV